MNNLNVAKIQLNGILMK